MSWVFLVFFSIGFISTVWNYFRPAAPDATDITGVLQEYRSLSKRHSLLTAALFFALILQEIGEITGQEP